MTKEQEFFLNNVKIILSPQEKQGKNIHITSRLDRLGVMHEKMYAPNHLKQGDYTFVILGKDYRNEFLIERKFGIQEICQCVEQSNKMTKAKEELTSEELRNNLEYEFERMCQVGVKEKWLFIENCKSFESIKSWTSGYETRNITAGKKIYCTLTSWACGNRYDFKIECIPNKENFSSIMIIKMFYYFRNDMKQKYGKNWLTHCKKLLAQNKAENESF